MKNTSKHTGITPVEVWWAVVFSIITCAIIVSNVLTLTVFIKTRLQRVRKRTHYLLISLTCADLMVGCFSCPIFIWDLIHRDNHRGTPVHLATHEVIDIVSGFASILTLAVIAIERLIAVRWPLKHRSARRSFYITLVLTPWIIAVLIGFLYVLAFALRILPKYTLSITAIVSITSALITIAVSYELVRKRVQRRNWRPRVPNMDRERKLTHTLMTITFVSLVTWLPFEVLLIVFHFCTECWSPFENQYAAVTSVFKLLQFSNSFLNTLFYTLRIPEYKRALCKLLKRPCQKEMALPKDKRNSAKLMSYKKYIKSPLLQRKDDNFTIMTLESAIRLAGAVPTDIVTLNSPLLSRGCDVASGVEQ